MLRQFRVADGRYCTLVNVDIPHPGVPYWAYHQAARAAGYTLSIARVSLVARGAEVGLPFDQVPLVTSLESSPLEVLMSGTRRLHLAMP